MKIANLASDQAILTRARQTVIQLFKEDPQLLEHKNQLLKLFLHRQNSGITWDKIS